MTTALFNKIAEVIRNWFDKLFGQRLLSAQAILVSVGLSSGAGMLLADFASLALRQLQSKYHFYEASSGRALNLRWSIYLLNSLLEISSVAYLWISRITGLYGAAGYWVLLAFGITCLACSLAHLISREVRWLKAIIAIPALLQISMLIRYEEQSRLMSDRAGQHWVLWVLLALIWSTLWDFTAIVLLRKLLASAAEAVRLRKVFSLIVIFGGFSLLVILSPLFVDVVIIFFDPFLFNKNELISLLFDVNTTTLFYCLIPIGLLILVLANRITWPILSRLLYPMADRTLMMDNKLMASVGGICLTFAFNLEKVGYKEVLKLFAG